MNRSPNEIEQWYERDADDTRGTANAVQTAVKQLQIADWWRRGRHMAYARVATGRPMPVAFSMFVDGANPSGWMGGTISNDRYMPVMINAPRIGIQYLENKIGSLRPWMRTVPNGADSSVRRKSRELKLWAAAAFRELSFHQNILQPAAKDSYIFGDGVIHTFEDDLTHQMSMQRVLAVQLLTDEVEATWTSMRTLYYVAFERREDLSEAYSAPDLKMADDERERILDAIDNAPRAVSVTGHYVADLIPVIQSWHLGLRPGDMGRRIKIVGSESIIDADWEYSYFPFSFIHYSRLFYGIWSQGIPELMWNGQLALDYNESLLRECKVRGTVPTYLVHKAAKIDEQALTNQIGRVTKWGGSERPEYIAANPIPPQIIEERGSLTAVCMQAANLNPHSVQGQVEASFDASGEAIKSREHIEDRDQLIYGRSIEDCTTDVFGKLVDVARKVRPKLAAPGLRGQTIDFDHVDYEPGEISATAFPVASIFQEPDARYDQIQSMYSDGQIDGLDKMWLDNFLDTEYKINMITAPQEERYAILDAIVEERVQQSVPIYNDLAKHLIDARARLSFEHVISLGRPEWQDDWVEIADLLEEHIQATMEAIANPEGTQATLMSTPAGPQLPQLPAAPTAGQKMLPAVGVKPAPTSVPTAATPPVE